METKVKFLKSIGKTAQRHTIIIIALIFWVLLITGSKLFESYTASLRKEVVGMIEKGELKTTGAGIELPEKYQITAVDKCVRIARNNNFIWIEFRTDYIWADEFEGIIYSSNDREPLQTVFFWESSKVTYHRIEPKWFSYLHE